MKLRETLDEAIDRVTSQMTQSDGADSVHIRPVWMHPPTYSWFGWRIAGIAGVAVVLLALAITRTPGVEERVVEPSIGASPLIEWSLLRAPIADTRSGREVGEPLRAGRLREAALADRESAPAFGIPFLAPPAALGVAAPTMMSDISIDAVAIDAIEVAPLSVSAIGADESKDSKEQ